MVSISICMIVKNEAAVLARCLEPLCAVADEIILVDTGSCDNTKTIAKTFTSKVYDFKWGDDFSAARNFSLSKAACEYIYVADADEVLDAENVARFLQLKAALLPEVEVVEMAYENQQNYNTTANFEVEYRPKLFRRLRRFAFIDPIHEVLRTDPVVYRSNIVVKHCPTSDHSNRDLQLFARMVRENQSFSPRLEMMYARELMIAGTVEDFLQARVYFSAVQQAGERPGEATRRAACVLAKLAAMQGDAPALLRYAAPELVGQPPAEVCCALGDYFLGQSNENQAADWYTAALTGAVAELVAASAGKEPLLGLATCYEQAGDAVLAAQYREEAKAWSAESWGATR